MSEDNVTPGSSDGPGAVSAAATWWENIKTVVWALGIAIVVRTFFFEPFNIPSGSMVPTLLIGDYMFVNKMSYGYSRYSFPFSMGGFDGRILESQPERGDVAVFRHPEKTEIDFVKRIVGLPGDRLQVKAGVLHINGDPVKRKRSGDYTYYDNSRASFVTGRLYLETLPNGVEHPILETSGDTGWLDNTPEFVVPEGHFFAMGDNRDNSNDSRVLGDVGYVKMENLIGRASFFFFSVDETASLYKPWTWPTAIRYSRVFNGID